MEYENLLEENKSRMAGQERNQNRWITELNEITKKFGRQRKTFRRNVYKLRLWIQRAG